MLVVIVTYNAMKWAERCFSSLKTSSVPVDVFVVDNGSIDGTQDYIRSNYPDVLFTQSETNLGFGRANNLGLEYALKNGYDYVYLLNQDAWVFEDTLDVLIKIQKKNPNYGIISPIQCNNTLTLIDENFYHLSLNNVIVSKQLLVDDKPELFETKFVMAAHWLISRECILQLGGFSPSFPHYGEDDNYINRAIFHGFKIGVSFNAKVVHDRENRPSSKSKFLYLKYIHYIVDMSNPNLAVPSFVGISWNLVKEAIKAKSFEPLSYLYRLLRDRSEIIENRMISKRGFSFLK